MNYFKTNFNYFKTTLNYFNFKNLEIGYIALWNLHHFVFNTEEYKPSFPSLFFLVIFSLYGKLTAAANFKSKANTINKKIKITNLLVEN